MMKKILALVAIAGTLVACGGEGTADPTDTLSPRQRDTFVVDPTGTRGIDTTTPLLGADTTGTGQGR
ncbi:hypothetical protein [Aridibaculum aurantiacum]|uniref:hypothetical protein n=1 Tax=Aridibaculum aurantiacum TaxID=2810307 RepID=UPI001A972476|nr:hypothetical protein [Aridibaculum aurantiacum]